MTRLVLILSLVFAASSGNGLASPFDEPGYHIKMTDRLGLKWDPEDESVGALEANAVTRLDENGIPRQLWFLDYQHERTLLEFRQKSHDHGLNVQVKWNAACIALRGTPTANRAGDYIVHDDTGEVSGPLDADQLAEGLDLCGIDPVVPWLRFGDAYAFSIATYRNQPEWTFHEENVRELAIVAAILLLGLFAIVGIFTCGMLVLHGKPHRLARRIGLALCLLPPTIGGLCIYFALL